MSRGLSQLDPAERDNPLRGPGKRLPAEIQGRMERSFGADLDPVRVHDDAEGAALADSQSASAVAWGDHIAFGRRKYDLSNPYRELVLAHEIAHSLQQRVGNDGAQPSSDEESAEANADRTAIQALGREQGSDAAPASQTVAPSGLGLRRCSGRKRRIEEALNGETSWTPQIAEDALSEYRGMNEDSRRSLFDRYFRSGVLHRMLRAASEATRSEYNPEIQDILRRAQLAGTFEAAAAGGLANEDAMAQSQAQFMQARNEQLARQNQPPAAPPPTPAQVAAQQGRQVEETTIRRPAAPMPAFEADEWNRRATAQVARVIAYGHNRHPELGLTADRIVVDAQRAFERGVNVLAFGNVVAGRRVAVVGEVFARLAEADPAYAFDTIVHEVYGHPEYGAEYGIALYRRAAARLPGYHAPTPGSQEERAEQDAYGYQETEIYSLLRQLPYNVPLAPAHAGLHNHPEPERWVSLRIGLMRRQWAPAVFHAMLRGMTVRFRMDPRLTPEALAAFERAVRANFTGAEAHIAEDILR